MKKVREVFQDIVIFVKANFTFKSGGTKSIAIIWLVSYLVIFLLPFLISIMVHFESANIITKQSKKMAEQIIGIEQNEINRLYNVCNTSYVSLSDNSLVRKITALDSADKLSEMDAYSLKKELNDFLWNQNIINDIWLIFNNIEYAISSQRAEPIKNFYESESVYNNEDFVIRFEGEYIANLFVKVPNGFAYLNVIPNSGTVNDSTYLMFIIEEEAFRERCKTSYGSQGIMLLYNAKNELLFSNKDTSKNIINGAADISQNETEIIIDNVKYVVAAKTFYNNKYVYLMEENIITKPLDTLKKIILISAIFSLLLGVATILYMIRRNIKPINEIVGMLDVTEKDGNEYEYIKYGINMQKQSQGKLHSKISMFKPIVMDNFIHNIVLYGNVDQYVLSQLDVKFDRRFFVLSVVDIDNMGIFFEAIDEDIIENNQRLMVAAVSNILGEVLAEVGNAYCGLLRDEIIVVLNTDSDDVHNIARAMEEGVKLLNQHLEIMSRIVIGQAVSSPEDVPQIYHKVEMCIENMQISGEYGAKIFENSESDIVKLSTDNKRVFINHILNNNCHAAAETLREIIKSHAPKGVIKYLVTDMLIAATNEVSRKSLDDAGEVIYSDEMINLVMEAPTAGVVEKFLTDYIETLCNSRVNENDGVAAKSYEFINSNFTNPELNVSALADKLKITPAYLSYKFREKYSINILDYLGKKRIEYAKQMLLETDMTIEDVYKQCGYLSRATFVRQFKKYTDLTPSKFKELYS